MAGVCNATRMRLALAWALLIKVPGVNQAARRLPRTNGLWFVEGLEAQWYRSTSHDPGVKRYKLLDGVVHVPPDAFTYRSMNWSGLMSRRVQRERAS